MVRLKVVIALLAILQLSACNSQPKEQNDPKKFILDCQLKGVPDGPVYLYNQLIVNSKVVYDTVAVCICKDERAVFKGVIYHPRTYHIGGEYKEAPHVIRLLAKDIWLSPGNQKYIIEQGAPNLINVVEGDLSKRLYSFQTEEYRKLHAQALKLNAYDREEGKKKSVIQSKLFKIREKLQTPVLKDYQDDPYFKLINLSKSIRIGQTSKEELRELEQRLTELKPYILKSDKDLVASVEHLIGLISRRFNSAIGSQFIEIEGVDRNGTPVKLSEVIKKNKYVLLEFWASWCGPCRAEFPYMKSVYPSYHPDGFEIFAITNDSKEKAWLKALDKEDVPWINIFPGHRDYAYKYAVTGIPANFLIDSKGVIVAKDLRHEKLSEKLKELFN
jgi:thiol-disulfide isomerase/thioredoxin